MTRAATPGQIAYYERLTKSDVADRIARRRESIAALEDSLGHSRTPTVPCWDVHGQAPAHLASVYDARRERTVVLTRKAIAELTATRHRITLRGLESASARIDPDGKGISRRAILSNSVARDLYLNASKRFGSRVDARQVLLSRVTKHQLIDELARLITEECALKRELAASAAEAWIAWLHERRLHGLLGTLRQASDSIE